MGAPNPRLPGLDALRGLAVILMIGQHLVVWLWTGNSVETPTWISSMMLGISALGGLAAPLFILLAGVGAALGFRGERGFASRRIVLRALTLFAFAYALSACTPSWFTWRSFYVLHLIATGFLCTPLLAKLSTRWLVVLAGTILGASSFLQAQFEIPAEMGNAFMSARNVGNGLGEQIHAAWLRALVGGHFSILPWLSVYVLGWIGGLEIRAQNSPRWRWSIATFIFGILGLSLGLAGVFGRDPTSVLQRFTSPQVPFFPLSAALCCCLAGIAMLLTAIITRIQPRSLWSAQSSMTHLGRISLTMLMLHLPIFRELSRPMGWWRNLSAGATLVVLISTIFISLFAATVWKRISFRGGAEWFLRQADRFAGRPNQ